MDRPKSSQRISQRITAVALAWAFLLVSIAGSTPLVHASAVTVAINSASFGPFGGYNVVKINLTSEYAQSLDLLVFAVWRNSEGQTASVNTGGLTLAPVASGTTFAPLTGALPNGLYDVIVFVITTSNNPVSSTTSFIVII